MELCQHDEFYKQREKQFTIKGNSKTGKLLVGMSIEERDKAACMIVTLVRIVIVSKVGVAYSLSKQAIQIMNCVDRLYSSIN